MDTVRRRALLLRDQEARRVNMWEAIGHAGSHALYQTTNTGSMTPTPYRPLSVVPQVPRGRPQLMWEWEQLQAQQAQQQGSTQSASASGRESPTPFDPSTGPIRWAEGPRRRARVEQEEAEAELAAINEMIAQAKAAKLAEERRDRRNKALVGTCSPRREPSPEHAALSANVRPRPLYFALPEDPADMAVFMGAGDARRAEAELEAYHAGGTASPFVDHGASPSPLPFAVPPASPGPDSPAAPAARTAAEGPSLPPGARGASPSHD